MSLAGLTLNNPQTYGSGLVLLHVKWAIGSTGAVGTVTGRGFDGNGPYSGSVTRTDVGDYTVVLPGRGAFHSLAVLGQPCVEVNGNDVACDLISLDAATRTATFTCHDRSTSGQAAEEAASGDTIHVTFLVKNTDVD